MRKRVLSTSGDENVLATRNLLMESAGYEVVSTRVEQEFLELLQNQHFDAAVIGDSIRVEVRTELARSVSTCHPGLPVIVFVRTAAEAQQFLGISEYVVEALGSPARFLTLLRNVLEEGKASQKAS